VSPDSHAAEQLQGDVCAAGGGGQTNGLGVDIGRQGQVVVHAVQVLAMLSAK